MRIIAGKNRGTNISAPQGLDTRPTLDRVRENLFNILSRKIVDAEVLDLFSGSGALAFESLSRGAARAVLCDHDPKAVACERANGEKLRVMDKAEIHQCDWKSLLTLKAAQGKKFDVVFLDPPYAMSDLALVTDMLLQVLADDGVVVIEHPAASFPQISQGYTMTDTRKYGYVGVSFFQRTENKGEKI